MSPIQASLIPKFSRGRYPRTLLKGEGREGGYWGIEPVAAYSVLRDAIYRLSAHFFLGALRLSPFLISLEWLVLRSANGVGHIDEVKLRRVRLLLGLVTTFDELQPGTYPGHSAWPSLRG